MSSNGRCKSQILRIFASALSFNCRGAALKTHYKLKRLTTLVILLLCLYCGTALAQTEEEFLVEDSMSLDADSALVTPLDSLPYPERAVIKLDSLCRGSLFDTTQLGLMVYDLDADSAIYRLGERQLLRPASTMKLVTAITALDQLGRKHRFRTAVYSSGDRDSTVLQGNIYVTGEMDPTLKAGDVDRLASAVAALGIDSIAGCIVADRSFKDSNLLGEGWCWDDDNPTLSPLLCNRRDDLTAVLREKIESRGIRIAGNDSIGRVPSDADLLEEHFTTLESVMKKMMKESDNLYAESMYYNIGASKAGPSTAKAAQVKERETMKRAGLNPGAYRLADGSGLSLYNYLSAECEVMLLRYAYKNKKIYGELCPTLPIAGVDGTLKKRMTKEPVYYNVRAKTGTVTGIYSLAGYCKSPEGHMMAFCIINQGVMSGRDARSFQDRVCEAICK